MLLVNIIWIFLDNSNSIQEKATKYYLLSLNMCAVEKINHYAMSWQDFLQVFCHAICGTVWHTFN